MQYLVELLKAWKQLHNFGSVAELQTPLDDALDASRQLAVFISQHERPTANPPEKSKKPWDKVKKFTTTLLGFNKTPKAEVLAKAGQAKSLVKSLEQKLAALSDAFINAMLCDASLENPEPWKEVSEYEKREQQAGISAFIRKTRERMPVGTTVDALLIDFKHKKASADPSENEEVDKLIKEMDKILKKLGGNTTDAKSWSPDSPIHTQSSPQYSKFLPLALATRACHDIYIAVQKLNVEVSQGRGA